jgi:hypothetical protein
MEAHSLSEQTRVQNNARIRRLQTRIDQLQNESCGVGGDRGERKLFLPESSQHEALTDRLQECNRERLKALDRLADAERRLAEANNEIVQLRLVSTSVDARTTATELEQAHTALHQMHEDFVLLSGDRDALSQQLISSRECCTQLQERVEALEKELNNVRQENAASHVAGHHLRPIPQERVQPLAQTKISSSTADSGQELGGDSLTPALTFSHLGDMASDADSDLSVGDNLHAILAKCQTLKEEFDDEEDINNIGPESAITTAGDSFSMRSGLPGVDVPQRHYPDEDEALFRSSKTSRLGADWTKQSISSSVASAGATLSDPSYLTSIRATDSERVLMREEDEDDLLNSRSSSEFSEMGSSSSGDEDRQQEVSISDLANELELLSCAMERQIDVSDIASTVLMRFSASSFGIRTAPIKRQFDLFG